MSESSARGKRKGPIGRGADPTVGWRGPERTTGSGEIPRSARSYDESVRFGSRAASDPFAFLVRTITYQQLAGKAAATIHGRLIAALGGTVTPSAVEATSEHALRSAGLSRSKLASIRDLAGKVGEGVVALEDLADLSDQEVVERLVQVRGIGRWTAEMLLLFHLRRRDVWPIGDLGVRAGMARVLGWPAPPSPRDLELIGLGYRPWRSATAWYCWRAGDMRTPA